jgi:glycosyltransferase involved in cell wall biosynthesis
MINNSNTRRRIGIDARFYGPLGKGLGRYVQEVVDNLIKLDFADKQEFEYVIFLGKDNFNDFHIDSPLVRKKLVSLSWYSWQEQLFFPFILKREKLDLVHFPHFNVPIFSTIPFVVTIHDLILTRFPSRRASMLPTAFYWFKQAAYRLVIRAAVSRAKAIITVSNFTRQDIIAQFGAKPEKLFVTYEGVADLNKIQSGNSAKREAALSRYGITAPFLLYVGNAYPHKNLESLLSVFSVLRSRHPDLSLVMVGKEDYFYRRVKAKAVNLGLWSEEDSSLGVVFPGYVPDEDLREFYTKALFYVFPSFYEGFGLPPLEAMAHSCPVASSNQASLPEIIGDAALYFNPYDEEEMTRKLESFIADENFRQELISRGLERIKIFSWRACAQQTLEIYRRSLGL